MEKYLKTAATFLTAAFMFSSCEGFLDAKPDKDIVVPSTLQDLQALLDNGNTMNVYAGISDIGTDDVVIEEGGIGSLSSPIVEGNAYLWKEDLLEGLNLSDWQGNYKVVLYSNIVLEQLGHIEKDESNKEEWERIRGSALFYRAYANYDLLRLFAPLFDVNSDTNLGIPLRQSAEPVAELERSSVANCYHQVLDDLQEALHLLPDLPVAFLTRPSKQAVYGQMARVFLAMGDYENAVSSASECLQLGGDLMNFEELDSATRYSVPQFNSEVLFHALQTSYSYLRLPIVYIDDELLASYKKGDLRRSIYFIEGKEGVNFRGNYSGGFRAFGGIALDEIYLIMAESLIRTDRIEDGMGYLNELLRTRWQDSFFILHEVANQDEALSLVLAERRKSLVFRGRRWEDLKRLNLDIRFEKKIQRDYGGLSYILPPLSNRYLYPIPLNELSQNPISQNNRTD